MLTIKHVATDGSEQILEAENVKVIENVSNFDDGIFLDWEQHPHGGCNWKHVIHFTKARTAGDTPPVVYVMNRSGATVAKYAL